MTALSDLLNSQPLSARQAADEAEKLGIDLPYGTIAGYWAGKHGKPTPDTLAKLAAVVPTVSLLQLQEAAWTSTAPLGPYKPPKESVHLNYRQRRALDALIQSMVLPEKGRLRAEFNERLRTTEEYKEMKRAIRPETWGKAGPPPDPSVDEQAAAAERDKDNE